MAKTLSNLYVEKASSEHPLALWMLDEQVDYVSQITEEQRQLQLFDTWQLQNAEAISESSPPLNVPFPESAISRIIGDIPALATEDIIVTSQFSLSENLVSSLSNFNVGFYLYLDTALCSQVSFGYQYVNSLSETVEVLDTILVNKSDSASWKFFSGTFNLPPETATNSKLLIKLTVNQGGVAGDYDFIVNGLSVGQWSEDFNKTSYGIIPEAIPATINLPAEMKAIPAYPYGASGENGYYLSQGYQLFCKNFGVPLVFGSSNVTKIFPNVYSGTNYPSIIFPASGFLNERGRYNSYTVEMWLRINSESSATRKIFGPIAGLDGLYVDGPFLTFKLGQEHGSHYVGEWFRPMLIHIRYQKNSVVVLLNGEEIIKLVFEETTLELPTEYVGIRSQDWVGFYAYEDVKPIDIDSFSIYSYTIPTEVAKRRWVWGQAVTAPEQTNSSINSITAYNDYSFANYSSNYNYPDFANWKQAFYSNIEAGDKDLRLPEYSLPTFQLGTNTVVDLYSNIQNITPGSDIDDIANRKYLTLAPNSEWSSASYFIHFDKFGVLNDPVETFYGVFKTDGTATNEPLIKITNTMTRDYLLISINGVTVTYTISLSGILTTITTKTVTANQKFTVGLNIKLFSTLEISEVNGFFANQSILDMYVAGDDTSKFSGKIYKIGADSTYNNRKISSRYDSMGVMKPGITAVVNNVVAVDGGITYTTSSGHDYSVGDIISISGVVSTASGVFNLTEQAITQTTSTSFTIVNAATGTYTSGGTVTDNSNIMFKHTANYTLVALEKYGLFFADIAVAGYWEDYMPLSYFSKAITDYDGNINYELDSIQFNQDFPEPPSSAATQSISIWNYADLQIEYSNPVILTYEDLNNAFYTNWSNYLEMSQNSIKTNYYNTENSALNTFISFQYIANGANNNLIDFTNKAKAITNGILDPSGVASDWRDTAYEVTTGTVIYPPKTVNKVSAGTTTTSPIDFNDLAIVYHLDFKSEGILHQKIKFKELQLASHVLERTNFTPVGSRFGVPVYYYSKSGIYYDLKAKNPIATYKKSTPYLYLNRQSGWKLRGEFSSLTDRGLAIPVNLSAAEKQEVSSIQMWLRFSELVFPEDPIMIFSIEHNDGIYDFYIQSDSSTQRGRIFAVNQETSEVIDTIDYYLNGQSVYTPYLVNEEWAVLGLEFADLLDFSSKTGKISLNGPLTYNNVSYNLATNIEKDETLETRSWADINNVIRESTILNITKVGTSVTYFSPLDWTVGDSVTITDVVPIAYNLTDVVITSVDSINGSFTVTSPTAITEDYISGGIVSANSWKYIQTELVVIDDSIPPYAWQQVKVIAQSRIFSIDPEAIYQKYMGSNRIIIDDESRGILVQPEKFRMYNEVSWSTVTKIAI